MPKYSELDIPSTLIAEESEGFEIVRFWIGKGNDYVSLHLVNDQNGHVDVAVWGRIAADIVKHAVRALLQDDPSRNQSDLLAEIESAFLTRLKAETQFDG